MKVITQSILDSINAIDLNEYLWKYSSFGLVEQPEIYEDAYLVTCFSITKITLKFKRMGAENSVEILTNEYIIKPTNEEELIKDYDEIKANFEKQAFFSSYENAIKAFNILNLQTNEFWRSFW